MRVLTTTCLGPVCGPSSGCNWSRSVILECVEQLNPFLNSFHNPNACSLSVCLSVCLLQRQFFFDSIYSQSTLRCRNPIDFTVQTYGYTKHSKPTISCICHPLMNKISSFFRASCIYLFSEILKINGEYFPPHN